MPNQMLQIPQERRGFEFSRPRMVPPPANTRNYAKHETIYRAGDAASHFYEILKGSVFICKILDDGRRQLVDIVRAGDFCGFSDADDHISYCEALEPVVLVAHERAAVMASPALQRQLFLQMDRRVSALYQHAVALGRKTASERVASLIMKLFFDRCQKSCPDVNFHKEPATIHMPMTRGEIADYLGLTLETVCRTLTEMDRSGLIKVGQTRGEIQISNVCRLCLAAKTDICTG